ncbi:fanconi-associated nuclease 1 homolog isoform X2 [Andrographis paniculata]|uniref:fanconi-associated nuclease 1 homolog isoform X2 n=1 Tax=Andrographis paniculata TaxID=175694 RepID=UPI0021E81DDF|nr:fanconi-associated nuclease 1 homolog isoform X2 [Andrographis paniculata]
MLTGRESLLRVIGKPRRFLPNRRSILSDSSSTLKSRASRSQNDDAVKSASGENSVDGGAESVCCPVCGARLPALDNTAINSHLDECLSRGSKRKLSQLTLLDLNFSRSKIKVESSPLNDEGNQVILSDANNTYGQLHSSTELDNFVENVVEKDIVNHDFVSAPLSLQSDHHVYDMEEYPDNYDISKVFLPTFIVGRRHGSRHKLDLESRICLSRDPENVRDSNAIKVLCEDGKNDDMLGYIPRELAQYLAPLIDRFDLKFEGHIASLPKKSHAAVPIQIVCSNAQLLDQLYKDNMLHFMSLWRDVQCAVKLKETNSNGTTRYQQNLVMLIQDVLKNHPHLFMVSEMSFLEAFTKLSDDSQRLFARLYTRKGPWFRMSNISYSEIADCHQAVKGLLEAGYVCTFPWENGQENSILEEVLTTLSVDELREALRVLNEKCSHGTRKQDLIDLILSSRKNLIRPELQSFVIGITGSCIRISPLAESLIWRAERLFFLNGEQDLSSFLLVDLGIVKYPAYRCIISGQIFSNRSDFLAYEEAIEISQIMVESLDENKCELVLRCIEVSASRMSTSLEASTPSGGESNASFLFYFSAPWVYSKVVLLGISFFEREKRYIEAISLLRQLLSTFISDGRRGYWTLRLSVDLEHLGRIDESLQVAEDGLLDPWVRAGSKVALQRRVLRLGKPPRRWKIPNYAKYVARKIPEVRVQGRPLNCKTGMKSVFYGEDGAQCGVEQLALQYYAGEGGGWQGVHSESGIWLTIFGLLMWDAIFADVPDVFRTKFQASLLELFVLLSHHKSEKANCS